MLEQTATVVAIRGSNVVVEVLPQSTCNSCAVNKGCGTSLLANSVGRKIIHFELPNAVDAAVGDRLVLGLPEDAVVKGSLLMYLLPLVIMFAAALGADALLAADDSLRDLKIAVIALGGLAASVVIDRRFLRSSRTAWEPVILRREPQLAVTTAAGPAPAVADSDSPS